MYCKKDVNNKIIETINDLQFVDNPDNWEEITNEEYQAFLTDMQDYKENYKLYFETAPVWWSERIKGYGSWQEQLDMQYHDSIDGTTNWKDKIAQVKIDNPKTALPQEQINWLQANGLYTDYCAKNNIEVL